MSDAPLSMWERASPWSLMTFSWVQPLMLKARRHDMGKSRDEVVAEDFGAPVRSHRFSANSALWESVWGGATPPKYGLVAVVKMYPHIVAVSCLLALVSFVLQLVNVAIFFQDLALLLGDPTQVEWMGWVLVACMTACNVLGTFLMTASWMYSASLAERSKAGLVAMAYRKSARLKSMETAGLVTNIISNDSDRVFECVHFAPFGMVAPLHLIATFVLVIVLLGWPGIIGMIWMPILFVSARLMASQLGRLRFRVLPISDARISQISELLSSIATVKLYNYEDVFAERVSRLRSSEVKLLRLVGAAMAAQGTFVQAVSQVPVVVSLLCYIALAGVGLSPSLAFTVLSLLNGAWFSSQMFIKTLTFVSQAEPCFERLRQLMRTEEFDPGLLDWRTELEPGETPSIVIDSATFSRADRPTTSVAAAASVAMGRSFLLRDVSIVASVGTFTMVAGPVGSGKSTLMLGILGEVGRDAGTVRIRGSLAYCSQAAFIINGSVRENILFGLPLKHQWYLACVRASSLEDDLEQLRDGDETIIGERGVNLSGGQKARVSIARALYANRDCYLFDDVLSALDARVARRVLQSLLGLLRGKVVMFCNHQLQFSSAFDQIVVLHNGRCVELGSFGELSERHDGPFRRMLDDYMEVAEDSGAGVPPDDVEELNPAAGHRLVPVDHSRPLLSTSVDRAKLSQSQEAAKLREMSRKAQSPRSDTVYQLVQAEALRTGRVGWRVWYSYAKAMGVLLPLSLAGICAFTGLRTYCDFHLAAWVSSASHGGWSWAAWATVYAVLTFASLVLTWVSLFGLLMSILRAANQLHNRALRAVLRGTMAYFVSTPVGRILNRFTKDVELCDYALPSALEQCLTFAVMAMAVFVAVCVAYPLVLASFPVMVVVAFVLSSVMRSGSRQARRIAGTQQSKVISTLNTTLAGIVTIRAFNAKEAYERMMEKCCDELSSTKWGLWMMSRWFNLRLDLLVFLLTLVTSVVAVATRSGSGAAGSLAISYTVRLANTFQWSVRNGIEVENNMTAAERLDEMADPAIVPVEPESGVVAAPDGWPWHGEVEFDCVDVRYVPAMPLALRNVSFRVPGGARCGIVGRTGAGKSSIVQSLFRMVEVERGAIRIDGVDISAIPLRDLRRALAVLPQDPCTFSGSYRFNLDPYNTRTNDEIARVLRAVHLDRLVQVGLDADVEDLSQGERQLLSMARALLRGARIVVADEPTASVDTHTDGLLQEMLRTELQGCTVISIAHRLQTVITSDTLLLLDAGEVREQDRPAALLATQASQFRSLVLETGEQSSRHLFTLASREVPRQLPPPARDPIQDDFDLMVSPL